jgi:outer membrane immunogenic protein
MRKNNLLTSTALTTSAMLASSAALAQSPPVYNWSGFYIGVNAGGGWAEVEEGLSIPGRLGYQTSVTDSGFTGGVQLGYNWFIAPNWLFGIEGDINYLRGARQDTFRFINTGEDVVGRQETKLRRLSTVRGRLGYVWASTAFYATGGLAIGDVKSDVSATRSDSGVVEATFAGAYSSTRTGWTAGGGIEHFFSNRFSLKVEYLHFDLGDFNYNVNRATGTDSLPAVPSQWLANGKVTGDIVRFGVNYRFAP